MNISYCIVDCVHTTPSGNRAILSEPYAENWLVQTVIVLMIEPVIYSGTDMACCHYSSANT